MVAQGSEKGFGIPFMSGVNPEKIKGEKYVHVVSCNTHGSASVLQTFSNSCLNDLERADFVIIRRSDDLVNSKKLVTANVVARHLDPTLGTHHAIDVKDLFKTIDVDVDLTASDITTPSQLMHAARFNLSFKGPLSKKDIVKKINDNPFMGMTTKFDSAKVFELGRRYGFQGRMFFHSILVQNNLLIEEKSIKGWIFVPQEGNTLLSTIEAFLLQTAKDDKNLNQQAVFSKIRDALLLK